MNLTDFLKNSAEEFGAILLSIDREDIEAFNFDNTLPILQGMHLTPRKFYNRLSLTIQGYDDDPRELFEIKEVRDYITFLDKSFPYWFFYSNINLALPASSCPLAIILACTCASSTKEKKGNTIQLKYDSDALSQFYMTHFQFMNQLMEKEGYTKDEIEKRSKEVSYLIR